MSIRDYARKLRLLMAMWGADTNPLFSSISWSVARNVAQGAIHAGTQCASQQEAFTQTEQADDDASYQQGRQTAIREGEEQAMVLIANAVKQERQQVQEQVNTAVQQERLHLRR